MKTDTLLNIFHAFCFMAMAFLTLALVQQSMAIEYLKHKCVEEEIAVWGEKDGEKNFLWMDDIFSQPISEELWYNNNMKEIMNNVGAIGLGFILGTLVVIVMAIVDLYFINIS